MKTIKTVGKLRPESTQPQRGPSPRGFDLEWVLFTLEHDDVPSYRTIVQTIEHLEFLSVAFIELEEQLLHRTGVPDGLAELFHSYFSMLDDSISLLFSQICQSVIPCLCTSYQSSSDSTKLQQEFDFSI